MVCRHERQGNRFKSRTRHRCIPFLFVPQSSGWTAGTKEVRKGSTGGLAGTPCASQRSRCISCSFSSRLRRSRLRELLRLATGLSEVQSDPASPCDSCEPPAERNRDSSHCNTGISSFRFSAVPRVPAICIGPGMLGPYYGTPFCASICSTTFGPCKRLFSMKMSLLTLPAVMTPMM